MNDESVTLEIAGHSPIDAYVIEVHGYANPGAKLPTEARAVAYFQGRPCGWCFVGRAPSDATLYTDDNPAGGHDDPWHPNTYARVIASDRHPLAIMLAFGIAGVWMPARSLDAAEAPVARSDQEIAATAHSVE